MLDDREQIIRLQFLEEAKEYLSTIESAFMGLSNVPLELQSLDPALRAAHSIKGGAAMMEFNALSYFSHRLEDSLKVLNSGQRDNIDEDVEILLLNSIDCLRQLISASSQVEEIEKSWLEINIEPIFEQLYACLGEPEPEDELAVIATEADAEIKVLLFQTEVEEYLQRLDSCLADSPLSSLSTELSSIAQELAGLSQMLKLDSLGSLCESIVQQIITRPEQIEKIAKLALQEWRKVQAMVISGQLEAIPTQLNLDITILNEVTRSAINGPEPEIITKSVQAQQPNKLEETVANPYSQVSLTKASQDQLDLIASLESLTKEKEKLVPVSNPQAKNSEPLLIENSNPSTDSEVIDNSIRVSIRHLDSLNELFGEYTVERNSMSLRLKRMRRSLNILQQKIQLLNQLKTLHRLENKDLYSPVKTSVMTTSIEVGKTRQEHNYPWTKNYNSQAKNQESPNLKTLSQEEITIVDQIEKITRDLNLNLEEAEFTANAFTRNSEMMQTRLNQIRMRPLAELVAPFPRALRNLELQYGKKAQLKIRGSSTLIDRTIIESLRNPLIQLVRNAFAHGIEDPDDRRAKGKSDQGTITINASYRGDRIAIAVQDDGRGIDIEKIRAKAVEKGVISADSSTVKDIDLLQLIFSPGFSTAEELTDLAGRGIGMDVVKTNLAQIGGTIEVDTLPGVGTTFTIAVPFKLSVLRVLLVESNGMLLAFPSNVVEEMLIIEPSKIFSKGGQEFFNLERSIVPLLRLDQCLQLAPSSEIIDTEELPSINQPTVLMITQGSELFGIQTDRYWREEEVTIRQVEGHLPLPEGFCGCTLLGDGQVVPLVDVLALLKSINEPNPVVSSHSQSSLPLAGKPLKNTIFKAIESLPNQLGLNSTLPSIAKTKLGDNLEAQNASQAPATTPPNPHNNRIMIIDDSVNVRQFLALTLTKAGYQVEQAGDGQEALEKLAAGVSVYLIICDLEMPRLDGFGFLSQIKSNAKYQHLPVIMLTSRSGEKHRQAAMNLGAEAYINKPLQKQELWKILTQLNS